MIDVELMLTQARERTRAAAARLADAGARTETLAELMVPKRMLGVARPAVLRPVGRVWRLGVLLLDADGGLLATGSIIRVAEPGHHRNVSNLSEERRELRAAALRGRIPVGETVVYDAAPIALTRESLSAGGPLLLTDAGLRVRWSTAATTPFDAYLDERVELLAHPPQGA